MRIALISRTVIMLVWLAGLLWQAERNATTALIAVSLVAVWAAPLLLLAGGGWIARGRFRRRRS